MKISKSKFVAGVQCLKRLYLLAHEPQLASEPDDAAESIIKQGREVGLLARRMFPGGVAVENCETLEAALRRTKELIANPHVSAIFEAAFEHGNIVARVDVLQRRRDGRWRLVEVKSSTYLKHHHLDDVAIQYRVVSRCGLDVASACLAHVNRDYVFQGGDIDPRRFFRIRNLTGRVKGLQTKLTFQIRTQLRILQCRVHPRSLRASSATTQSNANSLCTAIRHCPTTMYSGFLASMRVLQRN
jgi:predicted RecB family nuclease